MKTPEEFAEAMKGKETFSLRRAPEGPFTVNPTRKKVPVNIWWPEITNAQEADQASRMGSGAALVIALVTAIVATVSVFINAPILGVTANSYIDVTVFAFIAWGIRCRSNFVSAAGLAIFILDKASQFITQPRSISGLTMTILLACGFLSGIRGTRAYWRFAPEKAAAQARSFKALWKTPGVWMTFVLSSIIALATVINMLHVLQACLHPSTASPAPLGTPWGYVRMALAVIASAGAIFAIVQRTRWGKVPCIAFALFFIFFCTWILFWRVSIDAPSGVVAWAITIGFLSVYLYAVCLSEGVDNYFRPFIDEPTSISKMEPDSFV